MKVLYSFFSFLIVVEPGKDTAVAKNNIMTSTTTLIYQRVLKTVLKTILSLEFKIQTGERLDKV